QVIDGRGKTLLPGLFDAHTHLGIMRGEEFLGTALNFGVTTELEMFGSAQSIGLRNKLTSTPDGSPGLADLRTPGTGGPVAKGQPAQVGGPEIPTLGPNDDVQAFVDARIAEGADYIKIIYEPRYPTLTPQQLADVVAAAHRRNKLAVVHVTNQGRALEVINAGADGLVHIFNDSPPRPEFAELAAAHHVFVVPTLTVFEMISAPSGKPWWDTPALAPFITPAMRQTLEIKFSAEWVFKDSLTNAEAAVRALHKAGVRVLAGTDAPVPGSAHGLSLHHELELLVQSGLTP